MRPILSEVSSETRHPFKKGATKPSRDDGGRTTGTRRLRSDGRRIFLVACCGNEANWATVGMVMRVVVGGAGMFVFFFDFFEVKPGNDASGRALRLCGLRICRNEATLFLQFGESGECAVKTAFSRSHGALDESHEAGIDPIAEIARFPGARFEFAETAQTPEVLSEFVDQDFFGGVGGLVLVAKGSAEMIELGGIFAGYNELLRVQAVPEGVLRGAQFSFRRARTGGMLSVLTIRFSATAGCLCLCFARGSGARTGRLLRSHRSRGCWKIAWRGLGERVRMAHFGAKRLEEYGNFFSGGV